MITKEQKIEYLVDVKGYSETEITKEDLSCFMDFFPEGKTEEFKKWFGIK